jgi:hypothetical protein
MQVSIQNYNVSTKKNDRTCRQCHFQLSFGHSARCPKVCPSKVDSSIECPLKKTNPSKYMHPSFHGNDDLKFATSLLNGVVNRSRGIELEGNYINLN